MIKTLITNFTTLKKAEFAIDGLTVLRANSNGGKSSTVNAIFAGVTAEFPPSALRWGESQSVIDLQFADGQVQLVRTGGSSSYKIASSTLNQSYSKFGRKLPDEVVSFLNLCTIQVGDEALCLNFHQQFAKPLSLAMSHNKFVSLLSSSDLLEEHKGISKKLSTRAYELQGSIDSFSSLASTTQLSLDAKASVYKAVLPFRELLDAKYNEVVQLNNVLAAITALADKVSALQAARAAAEFKRSLLDRVLVLTTLQTERDTLAARVTNIEDVRLAALSLKGKQQFMELWYKPALGKLDSLIVLSGAVSALQSVGSSILRTKQLTSDVTQVSQRLTLRQGQVSLLDKVIAASNDKQDLELRARGLSNLKVSVHTLGSVVKDRDNKKLILDNNLCPLCMSPLGAHKH